MLFDSARSLGIYKYSSLLESDLKVRKYHDMLKNLYEPEMDVPLNFSFKITAEIEIRKHMFFVVLRKRGVSAL